MRAIKIDSVHQVRPRLVTSTIWGESLFRDIYGITHWALKITRTQNGSGFFEALKIFDLKPTIFTHRVIA